VLLEAARTLVALAFQRKPCSEADLPGCCFRTTQVFDCFS